MKTFTKRFISIMIMACICLSMFGGLSAFAEDKKIHYWPLDENTEDVVSGLDFYAEAEDYIDGAYGESQAWDTTFLSFGSTDPVTSEITAFSVAAWFYIPSESQTVWNPIFSTGHMDTPESFSELYFHKDGENVTLRGTVGTAQDTCISSTVELDCWNHVVMTYDAEEKMFRGYFNGEFQIERDVSDCGFVGFDETPMYLAHEAKNALIPQIYIDDIVFAYYEMSSDEISALYSAPQVFADANIPEPTTAPATTAPATTAPVTTAPETTAPATTAPATTAPATTAPATTTVAPKPSSDVDANSDDNSIIPVIIIIVVAVAIIGVVVFIIIRKKKK